MEEENVTRINTFHLLGFQTPENVKYLVFFLFLIIYCVTMGGNLLIVILVPSNKALHTPMYFFLSQLSISDIILASDILPNMLHTILEKEAIITFSGCLFQFYFFCVAETLECLLLTVMSYDRYLAICRPLHYALIMNNQLCWTMTIVSWTLSLVSEFIHILTISKLQFCVSDIIDHYFCDLDPILQLSCSDTTIAQLEATALSIVVAMIPFFVIIISYVYIIVTILQIPSITGRQKAFSTCSSHLTIVFIFYSTIVCVYLVPSRGESWNISKYLSLMYTVVTPLLNPIIYSLRNKDLKKAAGNTIIRFFNLHSNGL